MIITLNISPKTVADLMTCAMEGSDPVTTAKRGGWCTGIYLRGEWEKRMSELDEIWYNDPKVYAGLFTVEVVELLDESKEWKGANLKKHRCNQDDFRRGLQAMAQKFPHQFSQVMTSDIDAPCADAFLQSMLFGEEKYA